MGARAEQKNNQTPSPSLGTDTMPKVLIADALSARAASIFAERGIEAQVMTGLSPDELKRRRQTEARETEKAVRHTAEERYRDMTKAELSDELAKRELPRTGTVDELRARLVGDDLHYTA